MGWTRAGRVRVQFLSLLQLLWHLGAQQRHGLSSRFNIHGSICCTYEARAIDVAILMNYFWGVRRTTECLCVLFAPLQECSVFVFEKRCAEKLHKPRRKETVTELLRTSVRTLERFRHPRVGFLQRTKLVVDF